MNKQQKSESMVVLTLDGPGEQEARFASDVDHVLGGIRDMLVAKNAAYGNSALDPVRIFSAADPLAQIDVRIDDKLSRIKRGHDAGEDVERDLIGYLVLRRIARERRRRHDSDEDLI